MEQSKHTPEELTVVNKDAALNTTDLSTSLEKYRKNKEPNKYFDVLDWFFVNFDTIKEAVRTMQSQNPEAVLGRDIQLKALAEEMIMVEDGFLTKEEMVLGEKLGLLTEVSYTKEVEKIKLTANLILDSIAQMNVLDRSSFLVSTLENKGYIQKLQDLEDKRKSIDDLTKRVRQNNEPRN